MEDKKLTKGNNKMLFGVCSGLAEYFNIDATLVRVLFVACSVFYGFALLAYLILVILLPKKGE